jgi:hypothetical protein
MFFMDYCLEILKGINVNESEVVTVRCSFRELQDEMNRSEYISSVCFSHSLNKLYHKVALLETTLQIVAVKVDLQLSMPPASFT